MDPTTVATSQIPGAMSLLNSGNIAITALTMFVLLQTGLIWYLLRGLMATKDVLSAINATLTLLNERISHVKD